MNTEYRQCLRCVMDTTDPEITFDENGFCNHCNTYLNLAPIYLYQGKTSDQKLEQLIKKIKYHGRNKPYDCIIGLSGGVDSSYVAYNAKKLGLRALTIHFDNGWNSELAVKNIEHIVKKLNYDYETYVVNWDEFKDIQLAFLKAGVANAEIPTDHAFLAAIYKVANNYNIKYILSGSNFATEGILPKSWGYNAKDIVHLKAIHKKFGTVPLKTYPTLGIFKELYYTYIKGIKMIRLLNYIPYVKKDAMKILEKELNWVYYGGKHYESVFTKFFQAHILPTKFSIDKRKAHLSTLICSGEITRDEALKMLNEPLYEPNQLKQDKEYVYKKLGITEAEFDAIINAPPVSYKEYPNMEKLLSKIYKIYHFFIRK